MNNKYSRFLQNYHATQQMLQDHQRVVDEVNQYCGSHVPWIQINEFEQWLIEIRSAGMKQA